MSNPPPEKKRSFGWGQALIVLFLVAVLVFLAIPQITCGPRDGRGQTLNNGRQVFIAAFNMANDFDVNQDPHLGWPGDLAVSGTDPVTSLSGFAERLVELDYVKRADVGKIFSAPGVEPYSGKGSFTANHSAFKIYLVREPDVSSVLFLATKNFTFGKGLDEAAKPYGEKGFVIVRKGGDAVSYGSKQQALDTRLIGLMPGHTTQEDPGEETSKNVWRD